MKVLILGDAHGHLNAVSRVMYEAREAYGVEAAIQVGDFGFYPECFSRWEPAYPMKLVALAGNHEHHRWLFHADRDGTLKSWEAGNLFAVREPKLLELGGRRIILIPGALNADRPQEWAGRREGKLPPKNPAWCNFVSYGMVGRALALGTADLVVSHSCPHSIGVGMVGHPALAASVAQFCDGIGMSSGSISDCGEPGLTKIWKGGLRPPGWSFGHFHNLRQSQVEGTTFTCVGCTDNTDGIRGVRPVIYDTETNAVSVYPDIRLGTPA